LSDRARLEFSHDGQVARLVLAASKANILDRAMMGELYDLAGNLLDRRDLRAIVLTADGPHFSFGASVEEHLPGAIDEVLSALSRLLARLLELPAPTIAAVRGQCLGGGLEVVLGCDMVLAEESAFLGCPEIKLAVFPPAASALLPVKIGAGPATEIVITGESWSAEQAHDSGLVTRTCPEGTLEEALDTWLAAEFLPRSPAALYHAVRAARLPARRALREDLPELERQYIEELMAEPDAEEGIRAFLEKRPPRWSSDEGSS
jgi:cyclohexa-1,5-dienecarbonyl-CoA hydratase